MSIDSRPNLLGLNRDQLTRLFEELGEKPFRARQLMKWIHQRGVLEPDAMTDMSKALREKLTSSVRLTLPKVVAEYPSADGSHKWIIEVASGSRVEMVFIPESGRGTLCISSQAGCSLDCSFCATGKQGFNSNLSSAEIVGQIWLANKHLGAFAEEGGLNAGTERKVAKADNEHKSGVSNQRNQGKGEKRSKESRKGKGDKELYENQISKVSNVVMMGMGEPLLNFDPVMTAINIMLDDCAYGLSKRKLTISTSGVVPAIDKLKDHTDASLAVSLHAPNDELRSQIMPINRRYPIAELLRSVRGYMESLPDRRLPVIEYTLIKGVNDHRKHARELAELLADFPCKINLIPFNPFELSDYERPSSSALGNFRQILHEAGYTVTVRTTRADDIGAACGQLVGDVADRTQRSVRHLRANTAKNAKPLANPDNLAVSIDGY